MSNIDMKLEKLREVCETRERHKRMAQTAAQKEKEMIVELVESGEVSIAELSRVSGRSRQTIYNWTTRFPDQRVRGFWEA